MQVIEVSEKQIKDVWSKACAQLEMQLSSAVYNTWIVANPLIRLEFGDDETCLATISSPTAFHSTNLKKNLHIPIKQVLDKITGKKCDIQYLVGSVSDIQTSARSFSTVNNTLNPELENSDVSTSQTLDSVFTQLQPAPRSSSTPKPATIQSSPRVEDLFSQSNMVSASEDRVQAISRRIGLRKDFTFETFAVSTTNEMAHAAATAVSNRPGVSYNPLFLYGGVGVGKTHLMHAIGNNILRNNQDKKIIYCTGEEFTNEIIQAIKKNKLICLRANTERLRYC
jgi:chromosomal replication initiator protein